MAEMHKRLIPAWAWAAAAVLAVGLAVLLFTTDHRQPPSASFAFDVSSQARIDPKDILFRETKRIALNIDQPRALALGTNKRLFVAGNKVVASLDPEGKELGRFTVAENPQCLAATADDRLLLGLRDHVEVRDASGAITATWPVLGDRAYLTSITIDAPNVFVADAGNRVVLHYDLEGHLLGRIGEADPARNVPGLNVPSPYLDTAMDPMGALWVVNPGKHGLENYRPTGDLVSSWYHPGMDLPGFCGCCNPIHIAFRSDGSVVTAEKGLNRIKLYAPDTSLLGVVATPEALEAPETKSLTYDDDPPVKDLVVDPQDRVLVLHQPLRAILVFEKAAAGS